METQPVCSQIEAEKPMAPSKPSKAVPKVDSQADTGEEALKKQRGMLRD